MLEIYGTIHGMDATPTETLRQIWQCQQQLEILNREAHLLRSEEDRLMAKLHDLPDGAYIFAGNSPDDKIVATLSYNDVKFWNLQNNSPSNSENIT